MATVAASSGIQRGLVARQAPVRAGRRTLVVQNAVKEVFMPALSSTMTGKCLWAGQGPSGGRPSPVGCRDRPVGGPF